MIGNFQRLYTATTLNMERTVLLITFWKSLILGYCIKNFWRRGRDALRLHGFHLSMCSICTLNPVRTSFAKSKDRVLVRFNQVSQPTSGLQNLAERTGFEPVRRLLAYTLSKRAPSASRTPLHRHILTINHLGDINQCSHATRGHLRQPRKNIYENKFSRVCFLATRHLAHLTFSLSDTSPSRNIVSLYVDIARVEKAIRYDRGFSFM